MSKSTTNPKVDAFLNKAKRWQAEMKKLRAIVLDCGLTEELKWFQPCYTIDNTNVAIISAFKDHCVLSFFKGALLKDPKRILTKPGENTQAGRWIKFTSLAEINRLEPVLKVYVNEAIAVEKAGLKVQLKKVSDFAVPQEFRTKLDKMPALKKAFEALTPGRQKAYLLHFSGAKQSETRVTRVEKCMPQILAGKGLND